MSGSSSAQAGWGAGTPSPATPPSRLESQFPDVRARPLATAYPLPTLRGHFLGEGLGWNPALPVPTHLPAWRPPPSLAPWPQTAPRTPGVGRGHAAAVGPSAHPWGTISCFPSRHVDQAPLWARPHARPRDTALSLADGAHARGELVVRRERRGLSTQSFNFMEKCFGDTDYLRNERPRRVRFLENRRFLLKDGLRGGGGRGGEVTSPRNVPTSAPPEYTCPRCGPTFDLRCLWTRADSRPRLGFSPFLGFHISFPST